jgi:hypothetical protein
MGSVSQAKTGQGADISGSFDTRRCALELIASACVPSISLPGNAALLVIRAPLCYVIHGLNVRH